MNPYPLASLNHFTRPFAMLPYLVPFFGAAPLDAPRLYAGAPSTAEGKQKRRADWVSRGVSFGLCGFTDIRLNQNQGKDYTSRGSGVNRLLPFCSLAETRSSFRANPESPWRIAQPYPRRRPRGRRRATEIWAPTHQSTAVFARISGSSPRHDGRRGGAGRTVVGWRRAGTVAGRRATSRRRQMCGHARGPRRAWCGSTAGNACCSRVRPSTIRASRRAHGRYGWDDRRCRGALRPRRARRRSRRPRIPDRADTVAPALVPQSTPYSTDN